MSALKERREALREGLTAAGFSAYSTEPDRFVPPAVFVGPGDPYVTREGANYGCEVVNLSVVVVVAAGVNNKQADDLDDRIEKALDALYALESNGFTTGTVGSAGAIGVNGQSYLSAAISVSCEINREEQP